MPRAPEATTPLGAILLERATVLGAAAGLDRPLGWGEMARLTNVYANPVANTTLSSWARQGWKRPSLVLLETCARAFAGDDISFEDLHARMRAAVGVAPSTSGSTTLRMSQLADLTPQDRALVESLIRSLAQKKHPPTDNGRAAGGSAVVEAVDGVSDDGATD